MNILLAGRNEQELHFLNARCNNTHQSNHRFIEADNLVKASHLIRNTRPHVVCIIANATEKSTVLKQYVIVLNLSINLTSETESIFQPSDNSFIRSTQLFTLEEVLMALMKLYGKTPLDIPSHGSTHKRIALPVKGGYKFLELSSIIRLEGSGSYTYLHTETGKRLLMSSRIGCFENQLPKRQFIRVHQSHIVQVNFITELRKGSEFYLILSNKEKIPVAKRRLGYVEQILFDNYLKVG